MQFSAIVAATLWIGVSSGSDRSVVDDAKFFQQKIRPVLAKRCWKCHGPDKQESELRLDSRDAMLEGGAQGPAINLDEPRQSLLLIAVRHEEDDLQMPPDMMLEQQQIQDLERWIKDGAIWPDAVED